MKAPIVKIGNSRGIRIPKPVFEQCGFDEEVELEIRDKELVVRSASQVRQGWGEAFQAMAERGDDVLPDELTELPNAWDGEQWEWK